MSFYVRRSHPERRDGATSWTGPIRYQHQAHREAKAWSDAGWDADVVESTDQVRAEVRAWQRDKALRP